MRSQNYELKIDLTESHMKTAIKFYISTVDRVESLDWLLSSIARLLFAAILAVYFWKSGLTKLGDGLFGLFTPSVGAYVQIFPKVMEAAGFDINQMSSFHWAVIVLGTSAEFILPLLIIIGLLTRLAALGMIVFIIVQSLTDLYGHHLIDDPNTVGAWFDKLPDSIIADQRSLWLFLLIVIVIKGAGPFSIDKLAIARL